MQRTVVFITTLTLFIIACQMFSPASNLDVQSTPATESQSASPTFTPIPTFTHQAPRSTSPQSSPPEPDYSLREERLIDGYAIRIWTNPNSQIGFDDILLIESAGQPIIRVDMVSAIHDLTGSDLNGDNYPEVVVETYSGGAHCCFGTQVYSLRKSAVLIMQKPESNAGGFFDDLNADDISEFVTYDDSFAYQYCPYAAGVSVKSILVYDGVQDWFVPASPLFPDQYIEDIVTHELRAIAAPGELGEWEGSNICAILPLSLDYLYMGQLDTARSEFYNRYSGTDIDLKWNEVLQVVQSSPLYTPEK